ncbi:MAG: FapA family protein, partial [Lachnoclostridium sp.]|nr:FapA family protein [Lachnoclostridium sp.]
IAEYIPATTGEFGFTVLGTLLTPKRGKDLAPIRGKGFSLSEDRKQYFSNITGIIELKDGRIVIENCFTIPNDVDNETGNIDFDGDVQIMGEVKSGFSVRATGHVTVEGHVEAASITAGKSILLKRGMQGKGGGFLQSNEAIYGTFFESVTMMSKFEINSNYLLNCNIFTQEKIIVSGKKGVIIGGITKANKGITCYNLGNPAEKTTRVFVGVTQEQMDEYQEIGKQIAKIDSELVIFSEGLEKLDKAKVISDQVITMKKKINQAISIKQKELNRLNIKHDELLALFNESSNATVDVQGIVYPGVEVNIDSYTYRNIEAFRSVIFVRRGIDIIPEGK